MKAFTKQQALELGQNILERFEAGLNGRGWKGTKIVLPIQLTFGKCKFEYPRDTAWSSSVVLNIPYFFRYHGPLQEPEHITLDEWLKDQTKKKEKAMSEKEESPK